MITEWLYPSVSLCTISYNYTPSYLFTTIVSFTENVTISNITDSSAVVSWTVSSISSPQEYTVEYGNDEDNLNETSDTIAVSDTSLTDQTYNTTLTGLTQGVLYHLRVATTNAGNVTFYSDTKSFRTVESGIYMHDRT